ncbi:MAG: PD-(D/E)XK nuclease family protein [Clostridia bacterium]|nr:PD-(D/E)XK nuclease family protein [Clostridia bacterium]
MLQLILGRAATGKSFEIHKQIKQDVSKGMKDIILLVPEQYSFETEKQMLKLFGNGFMGKLQVLNFSRMYEVTGQLYGGIAGVHIDETMRHILMSRAIRESANSLDVFKKYVNSSDFISQIGAIISEFKQADVTPEDLYSCAEKLENQVLSAKIKDIAVIFANYGSLLKGVYIDPLDDMEILYKRVEKHNFFKGKTIYIDGFKGFTGIQLKLLKIMLLQAEKVTVSFCCNSLTDTKNGAGVFSNVIKTARLLVDYAKNNNISVSEPLILKDSYYSSQQIKNLETILSGNVNKTFESDGSVNTAVFNSLREEVEFALKTIHKLVREENYRFSDFVIIARDISRYERMLFSAAKKFEVSIYLDNRRSLAVSPVARLVLSALRAAADFDSESILVYLKSGLLGFSEEEIALIEEYVYIWDIKGQAWCSDWNMNPSGLKQNRQQESRLLEENLLRINELRKRIIIPLLSLRKAFNTNAKGIGNAVYNLLISVKVDEAVKSLCDSLAAEGSFDDADFVMDSWDAVMTALDNMVKCYGEEKLSIEEYINMLQVAFSGSTIGSIPRSLDEVSCGSADRIRPGRPKVVFVLGLNIGEFPAAVSDGGLLLRSDRNLLEKAGIEISDRFRSFAIDESFLVYSALSCADEKVFAFSHSHTSDGGKGECSNVFSKIERNFTNARIVFNKDVFLPETEAEGFTMLAAANKKNTPQTLALKQYFESSEEFSNRAKAILNMGKNSAHTLSKELCQKLFGENIYLSPSSIDKYNSCAFSYFCRYVLNISSPQKANLDTRQRGTIVHAVLEGVINEFGKNIGATAIEELEEAVEKYMAEYLNKIEGSEYLKQPRFLFLYNSISKLAKYVVLHIAKEFANSDFVPEKVELSISKSGDIPALCLEFTNNKRVTLTGNIDRVDSYTDKDNKKYIRIVDYKTGSRVFKLAEVLCGLNLQMLIYLYAVKQNGQNYFGEFDPAGIFYLPSKRNITEEGSKPDYLVMNGMFVDNEDVFRAMDKENLGRFVPSRPKSYRQSNPMVTADDFETVLNYVELMIKKTANEITKGNFNVDPCDSDHSACAFCEFSAVCGIEECAEHKKAPELSQEEILKEMEAAVKYGN